MANGIQVQIAPALQPWYNALNPNLQTALTTQMAKYAGDTNYICPARGVPFNNANGVLLRDVSFRRIPGTDDIELF